MKNAMKAAAPLISSLLALATGASTALSLPVTGVLQAPTAGPKVAGKLTSAKLELPAGALRVQLIPGFRPVATGGTASLSQPLRYLARQSGRPIAEAEVAPDGAFLFGSVAPGQYTLRAVGSLDTPVAYDNDLNISAGPDMDIVVPTEPFIIGKVVIEGGTPLPLEADALPGDANSRALVTLQAITPAPAPTAGSMRTSAQGFVRRDGEFVLPISRASEPLYFTIQQLPVGYSVKSVSYGAVDLGSEPFRFSYQGPNSGIAYGPATVSGTRRELRVALAASSSPGFSVRGRVPGPVPQSGRPPVIIVQGVAGLSQEKPHSIGEVLPHDDGTFEFHQIPPGNYSVSWPRSRATVVNVTDTDVQGIQLQALTTIRIPSETLFTSSAAGTTIKTRILEITGPDSSDCGAFEGAYAGVGADIDSVIECVRMAVAQHKSFFIVRQIPTIDMGPAFQGFAGNTNGTIFRLEGNKFQPCLPQAMLVGRRGEENRRNEVLVCEAPPVAMMQWPAP